MKQIFVKAVSGRSVRDPETKALISVVGELKPCNGFWLKRIKQGDVVEAKAPRATAKKGE